MDAEERALLFLVYGAIAIWGLCLGSFATALIYRIPRGIPWVYDSLKEKKNRAARSACPSCGMDLSLRDLVPFFSWLFLHGRCRHCNVPISALYPVVELSTMLLLMLMFFSWGVQWAALPVYAALPFLVAAAVIDWRHMILPDSINLILGFLAALFVGFLWNAAGRDSAILWDHAISCVLLTSIFVLVSTVLSKIKGRDSLGWGDVKFLVPAGLFLGTSGLPYFMGFSGVFGLLTAFFKDTEGEKGTFPFGPSLILALYIHLFLTGLGFDYTW